MPNLATVCLLPAAMVLLPLSLFSQCAPARAVGQSLRGLPRSGPARLEAVRGPRVTDPDSFFVEREYGPLPRRRPELAGEYSGVGPVAERTYRASRVSLESPFLDDGVGVPGDSLDLDCG